MCVRARVNGVYILLYSVFEAGPGRNPFVRRAHGPSVAVAAAAAS